MTDLRELFVPEQTDGKFDENLLFEGLEKLKEEMRTKKNSIVFMTMIADSFKEGGKICEGNESERVDIIFEFKDRE